MVDTGSPVCRTASNIPDYSLVLTSRAPVIFPHNRLADMTRTVRTLLLVVASVALVPTVLAQDHPRQAREVDAFTEVTFEVPGTLYLQQGDTHGLELEAPANVLDELDTSVKEGTLRIGDSNDSFLSWLFGRSTSEEITAYVSAPTFDAISLAGSGTIVGETPVEGTSLTLRNAGSGEMDLEVRVSTLTLENAGSGTFRLRGQADAVNVQIAGSGSVEAPELTVGTMDIEVAGSGEGTVHVTDRLSVEIMGSGTIRYLGDPTIDRQIMGSGDIRPLENEAP